MVPDQVKLKDIKPALSGYLKDARIMLSPEGIPDEKTVHDVRVLMKRSRASMKLLKPQMNSEVFEKEYNTFRDTGRIMRTWREACVRRKTLKSLARKYPGLFKNLTGNEKIMNLLDKTEYEADMKEEIAGNLVLVKEMLNKSAYRIRFYSLSNLDPNLLLKELEMTYITVMDCYLTARNNLKQPGLHEFRKRAKDFLYQLVFFRALRPRVIKNLEKRLDSMTQDLGKYNDLSALIKELDYHYSGSENDPDLDELIVLIKMEQDRYLSRVWPVAYKIFCPGQKLTNVLGFKLLVI
jgi:CHAD domain-containing protein